MGSALKGGACNEAAGGSPALRAVARGEFDGTAPASFASFARWLGPSQTSSRKADVRGSRGHIQRSRSERCARLHAPLERPSAAAHARSGGSSLISTSRASTAAIPSLTGATFANLASNYSISSVV